MPFCRSWINTSIWIATRWMKLTTVSIGTATVQCVWSWLICRICDAKKFALPLRSPVSFRDLSVLFSSYDVQYYRQWRVHTPYPLSVNSQCTNIYEAHRLTTRVVVVTCLRLSWVMHGKNDDDSMTINILPTALLVFLPSASSRHKVSSAASVTCNRNRCVFHHCSHSS